MTQRKLTNEERLHAKEARLHIHQMYSAAGLPDNGYWFKQYLRLSDMITNGTTDGRPYVEPTPEIGEGYRVATEADSQRPDREAYCSLVDCWGVASKGLVMEGVVYRVPVDRIPTDEDAKQRPTVMVLDHVVQEWLPRTLLAVCPQYSRPFVIASECGATAWKQCRFPYPGELDQ